MLTLELKGATMAEMEAQARTFFGMDVAPAKGAPAMVVTDQVETKPEPKKAGRPKKMEEAIAANTASVATPPAQPAPAPTMVNPFDDAPEVVPSKTPTLDDVRSAFQEIAAKFPGTEPGKPGPWTQKVTDILAKFNTFKVSGLKPEQYQAAIDEAKKA
jgi:hypothetical protein